MAVNKVILVGNVGKDPETRYLDENTSVCRFPLATSESYRNKSGERVEQTEWHNIVLWRGLAQVAEKYVRKGSQLYIEGRIKSRSYDDKDGIKRYVTEIVGDSMQMLGRRQDEQAPESSEPESNNNPAASNEQTPPQSTNETSNPDLGKNEGPDDLPF